MKSRGSKLGWSFVAVVLAALTMGTSATMFADDDNRNPGVVPPHGRVQGKTYGEWGDIWWNWAVREPLASNPMLDQTGQFGSRGQEGQVWFLAGVFGGGSAERTLTVPAGKFLFVPLVNSFLAAEGTEMEERAAVNSFLDRTSILEARLDGDRLRRLFHYRAQSPRGGFVLTVPPNSLFTDLGAPPGDYEPAVSGGYYLLLTPLRPGRHELRFRAVVGDPHAPEFENEVTYHLTVAR